MTDESLIEFLESVEFFSAFTAQDLEVIASHVESRTFEFGDTVCNAGDPSEGLFLIKKGAVRLFTEERGKEISMGVRKEREVFGEISVLRHYRHESSVRSSAKTELLYFPHEAFEGMLERNPDARDFIANYVAINTAGGFVTRLFDLRRKVKGNELEQIIRSVGIKRVREGRSILEQGDRDDRRLYVVRQGRVRVVRNEENTDYPLATLGQGEVFGEQACLNRQEQPTSVIAETDVVLLVVPEKTIRLILERNPKLQDVLEERIKFTEREFNRQKKLAERRKKPLLLDFSSQAGRGERIIRRLGLVQQAEEMDCGAACLAMICKH